MNETDCEVAADAEEGDRQIPKVVEIGDVQGPGGEQVVSEYGAEERHEQVEHEYAEGPVPYRVHQRSKQRLQYTAFSGLARGVRGVRTTPGDILSRGLHPAPRFDIGIGSS